MPFKSDAQRRGFFGSRASGSKASGVRLPRVRSQDLARDLKRDAPEEFKKLKDSDKDKTPDVFDF